MIFRSEIKESIPFEVAEPRNVICFVSFEITFTRAMVPLEFLWLGRNIYI